MNFEIIGDEPEPWTDTPRTLTHQERTWLRVTASEGGRLEGVKLYRKLTRATLGVAVQFVDAMMAETRLREFGVETERELAGE